jgi:hypothetical protein
VFLTDLHFELQYSLHRQQHEKFSIFLDQARYEASAMSEASDYRQFEYQPDEALDTELEKEANQAEIAVYPNRYLQADTQAFNGYQGNGVYVSLSLFTLDAPRSVPKNYW